LKNNICVVGAGYWGKNHIRTLYKLNALGGIVENKSSVLSDLKKRYLNVPIFRNIDDALSFDKFHGYTVATPAETHYDLSKQIINSKKHVLIEKPFTLNVEHAEDLVNLAKKNKVNLMVGHSMLFHPAIIKIKELLSSGKIGKLQYIYSNRLNLGQVRTEENVFWSLAPHDISIFQYLTDLYPININAHGSSFLQERIHDSTITLIKYPNNIHGHIFVSWLHPFKEHRLMVIGSEGMLSFEDSMDGKPLRYYKKKFEIQNKVPEKIDGPIEDIDYDKSQPLTNELRYFIDHLKKSDPKIANGAHALEVTKILVKASNNLVNNEKN